MTITIRCFLAAMILALPITLAQFTSKSRLVEVYATVHDSRNNYIDGLDKDSFRLLDNGIQQEILAFESESSDLSCGILLDTTGSMTQALPIVKNAAKQLIDALRPSDSVAIYEFNSSLTVLQDFTRDKAAAKRAVLRTRAGGQTALFDALAQVSREVVPHEGKKVLVVFTDGDDNMSVLHGQAAAARAKKAGMPVYTVAEGDALKFPQLLDELQTISKVTGAESYRVKRAHDVQRIFDDIVQDMKHTYMMAYRPPSPGDSKWRTIQLTVENLKGYRIRAKEGYFPE
jgi:Ca-activated chloride channel homolog